MRFLNRSVLVSLALIGASACEPIIEARGNLPPQEQLDRIKIGESNRDDVQALLGTPSNVTPFGDETWHYISATFEREAFFEPRIKDRKVITVVFDRNGVVRVIDTKGMGEGKDVVPVDRETPTAGKELSVIQQMLGNVGKFSKDAKGN